MNEPRKPVFGFLWPKPDPDAPVDGAYRQVRRVRIAPRGPVRLATLFLGSVVVVMASASLIMAALTTAVSAATVVGGALVASAIVLILRGWVVGTYVSDEGLTVETTWRRTSMPWPSVTRGHQRGVPGAVPRPAGARGDDEVDGDDNRRRDRRDPRLWMLTRPVASARGPGHGVPAAGAVVRGALGPPGQASCSAIARRIAARARLRSRASS